MADIKSYFELFAPFYGVGTLFSCLGFLAGALVAHKLDLGRSRTLKLESDIKADKRVMIPFLDKVIEAARCQPDPVSIWRDCLGTLDDDYRRFKLHLRGRKLRRLNLAWQTLEQIPENKLCGSSKTGVLDWCDKTQAVELAEIQKFLLAKLEELRASIYDT